MCIITGLTVGLGMGITSALGMTAATTTTAMVAGAIGTTMIAGGIAGIGAAAVGVANGIKSSRISAEAMKQQTELLNQSNDQLEANKTTSTLQDNDSISRPLSSLRIPLAPKQNTTDTITKNVYGVDSNQLVSSTQNMTGLNIAA